MAAENATAIVIRAVPFSETSSVVTLFTRECGKLRALAKGAWRPKSAFDAALDLLSTCQVLVFRKHSDSLDVLAEARLENRFRIGTSLAAFHAGMYFAELLDALTADGDPQPELFDAARKILLELSSFHGPLLQVRARIISFELEVLRIVGHAPTLLRCAECETRIELTPRTAFAMLDGGTLCSKCRRGKRSVVSVSADALASLRVLAHSATAWQTIVLVEPVFRELRAIMSTYLAHVVGRRLKVAALLLSPFEGLGH